MRAAAASLQLAITPGSSVIFDAKCFAATRLLTWRGELCIGVTAVHSLFTHCGVTLFPGDAHLPYPQLGSLQFGSPHPNCADGTGDAMMWSARRRNQSAWPGNASQQLFSCPSHARPDGPCQYC